MYSCDSCKHNDKNWDELPCDDCTMGGKTHYYEPSDDAETVPRSVFEQFKWERDIAIEQLEQLGYGFGEEPRTDGKLIVKKLAVRAFATYLRDSALIDYPDAGDTVEDWIPTAESALKDVPTEPGIIRCKDCKHKPSGSGANHDISFPDEVCPCQCEDYWYSWMPKDDWFCGSWERREE